MSIEINGHEYSKGRQGKHAEATAHSTQYLTEYFLASLLSSQLLQFVMNSAVFYKAFHKCCLGSFHDIVSIMGHC